MMNCVIIDDEPFARSLLLEYLEKVPYLHAQGSYSSALEALPLFDAQQIDLLFLDIQMPDLNGIDFLKILRTKPLVIFTTAHKEFALDGYELDVVDYLLKPFDFSRFLRSVEKARLTLSPKKETSETSKPYVFLKEGHQIIKLVFDDILYIKGLKDYLRIITKDEQHIVLYSMKAILEKLPSKQFIRVHNSFIISLDQIQAIHNNKVKINDTLIPIGSTYKKHFFELLKELGL